MSCMFEPNFEAITYVTSVLEPETPPRKFGVKSGLIQKRLKYGKNISDGNMSLETFHPYEPNFDHDEVFFFTFLNFFFLKSCTMFFC